MASLARSLLALALVALLQAVSANFLGPDNFRRRRQNCTKVLFGQRSYHPGSHYKLPPIYITQANSDNNIDDHRVGVQVIGEEVKVCNRGEGPKPEVTLTFPGSFNYIRVKLGYWVPDPIDMVMRVTRFIKPIF